MKRFLFLFLFLFLIPPLLARQPEMRVSAPQPQALSDSTVMRIVEGIQAQAKGLIEDIHAARLETQESRTALKAEQDKYNNLQDVYVRQINKNTELEKRNVKMAADKAHILSKYHYLKMMVCGLAAGLVGFLTFFIIHKFTFGLGVITPYIWAIPFVTGAATFATLWAML